MMRASIRMLIGLLAVALLATVARADETATPLHCIDTRSPQGSAGTLSAHRRGTAAGERASRRRGQAVARELPRHLRAHAAADLRDHGGRPALYPRPRDRAAPRPATGADDQRQGAGRGSLAGKSCGNCVSKTATGK